MKVDRSSALQYLRSMVKRKRYDRKDHEMAKRHDRRYHGEAYLFVLCCFCKGPTLELLVFSFDRVIYQPSFYCKEGMVKYVLTTDMRLAHAR